MGFFDSITGFLGKVADGITHTIAPDLKWEPSSLLKQASKLLPGLADAIPGVGPLVSKGLSAVESIIGGHDTTDPTSNSNTVLPDLGEVKSLISDTTDAIKATSVDLSKRLHDLGENLSLKLDDLDVDIKKEIDKDAEKTAELFNESTRKIMEMIASKESNERIRLDNAHREAEHEGLKTKYDEFEGKISPAIHWWRDHIDELHGFISYKDSREISRHLGKSSASDLLSKRDRLRDAVQEIEDYMGRHMPPTQEIFDLYVLAVTWLLTYNKTVLTLRSFWAHSLFVAKNNKSITEYLEVRKDWDGDLKEAIRDAKKCANFILGAPLQRQEGFIDDLWRYRNDRLSSFEHYREEQRDREVAYFFDYYPIHGLGAAKFDLAYWRIDRQCLIVISTGSENNFANDAERIDNLVRGLHAGYSGLQSAYFQASTRVAREMAHSWRISADHWQSTAPLNPLSCGIFEPHEAPTNDVGKSAMEKRGLCAHDMERGNGYKKGDEISYTVSYVTNYGEGRTSAPTDSLTLKWDGSFLLLKVKAVEFPKDHGLVSKADAGKFDKDVPAHVVRRVYVTNGLQTRHLIDVSAPSHEEVSIWDLGEVAILAKGKVSLKDPKPPTFDETTLPDI